MEKFDLQQQNVSDNNFESCIKCTICTIYCPVTAVNPRYPGPKRSGPDGERYRLKKPEFFDVGLKYCLNCKRCEVACPAEVRIADIIQTARIKYTKGRPSLRDAMLADTDLVGSLATTFSPVVNAVLRLKPVKLIMDKTIGVASQRTFPAYASRRFRSWYDKTQREAQREFKRHVTYFHGCYVNYNYPQLGQDFLAVMNALGYGVSLLDKERCCGVAKIANRCAKEAMRDARLNMEEMRRRLSQRPDEQIALTSSTCCFTMRDEYKHILHLDNDDVRSHITLGTRLIYEILDRGDAKIVWRDDFKARVAYHVPCHMEKLGWSIFTAELMRMIPGIDFLPLPSHCCGIAGTYGFKKENYKYSQEIGDFLFRKVLESKCDYVVSDCETCKWQIEMSTGVRVLNPIEVLARAIDMEKTAELNRN